MRTHLGVGKSTMGQIVQRLGETPMGRNAQCMGETSVNRSTIHVGRRQRRMFDFDSFCDDLRSSKLLKDPPTDAEGLFECYDTTIITLWINTRHSLTLRFNHITMRLGTIMNVEH